MSTPISIRFPDDLAARVRRRAAATDGATSGLVVRLVDEGLRMADHPGILFRDGPTGRRAGLQGGPDVWEVAAVLRDHAAGGPRAAVRRTAAELGLSERQVTAAEGYYVAHPGEIDERIALNDAAAVDAARAADVRRSLYA